MPTTKLLISAVRCLPVGLLVTLTGCSSDAGGGAGVSGGPAVGGTAAADTPKAGSGSDVAGTSGVGASENASLNLIPDEGGAMTMHWGSKPSAFGPWFTYAFHAGTTIDPAMGIVTTDGKMCATLAGTQTAAGGGAIGFQTCGAPTYPNELGESAWFPLNCLENPADTCVPSETAMPSSFCGAKIAGVRFVSTGVINKVEFKGPEDGNLGPAGAHAEVIPVNGYAAAPSGRGGDITAIHFKSFNDGEICLASVQLVYE